MKMRERDGFVCARAVFKLGSEDGSIPAGRIANSSGFPPGRSVTSNIFLLVTPRRFEESKHDGRMFGKLAGAFAQGNVRHFTMNQTL